MSCLSRIEHAAEQQPGLYAFGTKRIRSLSKDEEVDAPFERRLEAIWPWIVTRSRRFVQQLSSRERAHLSTEDLVQSIVIALLERDAKWVPARGRYITFAEAVARTVSIRSRNRARIVTAPANAARRLKHYQIQDAQGALSPAQQDTMRALQRTLTDPVPIEL